MENYHAQRIALDSILCSFNVTHKIERVDSVRSLLEYKERQIFQIVRLMDEQQSINRKIASQEPVIVQKIVQEQPKKPKRKGFLGIFGKKEKTKPLTTTTTLRSPDRNMVSEQKAQSRRLSEQADSLAARNAELNRQPRGYEYLILLHGLFQLPYQIRCLAFVSFDALCIMVYDDIRNDGVHVRCHEQGTVLDHEERE